MIRLLLFLWRKIVLWSSNGTSIFMDEDGFLEEDGRLMIRLLLFLWRKMVLWSSNDKTTFIFMEEDGFVVV